MVLTIPYVEPLVSCGAAGVVEPLVSGTAGVMEPLV
jgi:hypothetical protein